MTTERAYGIQLYSNPERELTAQSDGVTYYRYPVHTPMVSIGEDLDTLLETYVKPHFKEQDLFVVASEKVVSITQRRVVHESEVSPTWLAKLICRFVTKYPHDVGFENPRKMQVAINQAGYLRMIAAVAIGGIMKFVFQQRGWFYRIAGNEISQIDGFNPIAVPPFNEYAILGPAQPTEVSQKIQDSMNMPFLIVDASNIATDMLGMSNKVSDKFNKNQLKEVLAGNPMGQKREQTPFLIITTEKRG